MQNYTIVQIGQLTPILPVGVVLATALVLVLIDAFGYGRRGTTIAGVGMVGVALSAIALVASFPVHSVSAFGGALRYDGFSALVGFAVLLLLFLTLLMSPPFLRRMRMRGYEYYPLLLLSASGMMLLPMMRELISVVVGIELVSIPLYILAGYNRRSEESKEAALKYFLLGAFASAILLYGAAFIYGSTGSLWLMGIANAIPMLSDRWMLLLGLGLFLVGFGFKVALFPFHVWVPDVYEGSPSTVVAFMSGAVKLALFAVLIKVLLGGFADLDAFWKVLFIWLSAATMLGGNLLALHQMSLKRLLAYSTIAHSGYLALGVVAATPQATSAMLFYLLAYAAAAIGAFAIIAALVGPHRDDVDMDDVRGIARTQPGVAFLVTVMMLSLAGIPPTAGFLAKFYLFWEVYQAGYIGLVIFAIVNSMISVYYYLRVIMAMYLLPAPGEEVPSSPGSDEAAVGTARVLPAVAWHQYLVGVVSVLIILAMGVVPGLLLYLLNTYHA